MIQGVLRHSDIAVTQRCYIKTAPPEAIAEMRQFSATLAEGMKCSDPLGGLERGGVPKLAAIELFQAGEELAAKDTAQDSYR